MEIDDILLEWSYRLKKGYPTMENGQFTDPLELQLLQEILQENGINEMPSFVKSKTPESDVISEADPNQGSLFGAEEMAAMIENPEDPEEIKKLKDVTYTNESDVATCRKQFEKTLMVADTLGPRTLGKLHNRMAVFSLYLPIYEAMKAAGFEAIIEKGGQVSDKASDVANGLQSKLENLEPKGYANFVKFLNTSKQDKPTFPDDKTGNLKILLDDQEVAGEILDEVAKYADTEGGRGVGMGEYMMAMSFSNIWNSVGAGDLAMGESRKGSENLELKGYPARLGATGENIPKKVQAEFEKLAEEKGLLGYLKENGYDPETLGGQGQTTYAEFFVAAHSEASAEQKTALIDLINVTNFWAQKELGGTVADSLKLTSGDMSDTSILFNKLGAQGLCAYMDDHSQQRFIAFDYGKKGDKNGDYIFGMGGSAAVAKQFSEFPKQIFENWRFNLTRPRIKYKK